MSKDKDIADELLERAYNLETASESKSLYKDWADTYDKTMLDGLGYLTPKKTAELLSDYLPLKQAQILDVGSGTGLAGQELASHGYRNIDALDYSAEMLEVARKRNVYQNLHQIDLTDDIALASNSYDAMISTGTFTHAHVGASCLDELFRILKPGGLLACTVHKDIWMPEGFDDKVSELQEAGTLKKRHHEAGTYFENSTEDEGWYIIWEKRQ